MAFPTTTVLDNFNRPNVGPPLSANWTGAPLFNDTLIVSSNVAAERDAATTGDAYWNVTDFNADCEVFASINAYTSPSFIWLMLRLQNIGVSTTDGYLIQLTGLKGVSLRRIDDGSATALTSLSAPNNWTAGDKVGVSMNGAVMNVFVNQAGAGWAPLGSTVDSTYPAGGFIGLAITDTVSRVDDFGGGSVVINPADTPFVPLGRGATW